MLVFVFSVLLIVLTLICKVCTFYIVVRIERVAQLIRLSILLLLLKSNVGNIILSCFNVIYHFEKLLVTCCLLWHVKLLALSAIILNEACHRAHTLFTFMLILAISDLCFAQRRIILSRGALFRI